MTSFAMDTTWGAKVLDDGRAQFRLWAPGEERVSLVQPRGEPLPMQRDAEGWFELATDRVPIGGAYGFALGNGKLTVPDPAARAQVADVNGLSRLIDPRSYDWKHPDWTGRPWDEAVIYELHVGTFSPEGTFEGVAKKLDHLAGLGITAVELMPVGQFGGSRGWGYDGVLMYAPHNAYGSPDDLKALVDAAHARGMMILLDVIYNHFGPQGNYLHLYAPQFFHPERQTPWGAAIAYEKHPVRRFFIDNALYWLNEYRFDGLRLDAIDQIQDPGNPSLIEELGAEVRRQITDRHIHLTTEDDRNVASLHRRSDDGCTPLYSGEWNDDFHHAAHVAATGEREGYYSDYSVDAHDLARALAEGYVYQGQASAWRDGSPRGEPCAELPPTAFVNFLQNHDQIGNRAFGERLSVLAPAKTVELLSAILLIAPHTPLIYMGEEWGETRPFCFFTDFSGDLADAVRDGRRAEFKKWPQFADPANREKIPDPNALATADASCLDWGASTRAEGQERMHLFRDLLALRAEEIAPRLPGIRGGDASYVLSAPHGFGVRWRLGDGSYLLLAANLGDDPSPIDSAEWAAARRLYESRDAAMADVIRGVIPPHTVVFALQEPAHE
jgi:malto-oligosyltrehalose trehalohydrolase